MKKLTKMTQKMLKESSLSSSSLETRISFRRGRQRRGRQIQEFLLFIVLVLVLVLVLQLPTVSEAFVVVSSSDSSLQQHHPSLLTFHRPILSLSTVSVAAAAKRNNNDNDNDNYDYYNYDDDDDYDDDDEPPPLRGSVQDFKKRAASSQNKGGGGGGGVASSFGWNRGRSSPSLRKAMGTSSKSAAHVYCCTNCGSESVKWMGRCPTCREWNTFQEFQVPRSTSGSSSTDGLGIGGMRAVFGGNNNNNNGNNSWLDGISDRAAGTTTGGGGSYYNNNNNNNRNRPIPITQVDLKAQSSQRLIIPDDEEFTNVLGGGFMPGSLLLLGGDPGVGKSTLALQIGISLAQQCKGIGYGTSTNGPVWYVSGEETLTQIASRAQRLSSSSSSSSFGLSSTLLPPHLYLFAETNLNRLAEEVIIEMEQYDNYNAQQQQQGIMEQSSSNEERTTSSPISSTSSIPPPSLLIIDSLQTMVCESSSSSVSGGIAQARECMALLLRLAKVTLIPILVIGHVTKSGDVAGPRMVEHMVDAVLYLEHGGKNNNNAATAAATSSYRWLRAVKNRFGSCDLVGLYAFSSSGGGSNSNSDNVGGRLIPSPELLDNAEMLKSDDLEGCAMAIAVEGNQRAMVVEVQALVTQASGMVGKKTVEGGILSYGRLTMLIGILSKHCQVYIGKSKDVFVNIITSTGGGGGSGSGSSTSTYSSRRNNNNIMALDLAVTVALASSLVSIPIRGDTAFVAQVGLLGELRPLPCMETRLSQAQRLGFSQVVIAGKTFKRSTRQYTGMEVIECPTLKQALTIGLTSTIPTPQALRSSSNNRRNNNYKNKQGDETEWTEKDIFLDDEDDDDDDDFDSYQ